jgi:hypothetical protein
MKEKSKEPQATVNDRSEEVLYHQMLGAKWMVEAIVSEMRSTFRENRNAQELATHIENKWQVVDYWRPSVEIPKEGKNDVNDLARLFLGRLRPDQKPTDEEIIEGLLALEREGKITNLVFGPEGFTCSVVPEKEEQA